LLLLLRLKQVVWLRFNLSNTGLVTLTSGHVFSQDVGYSSGNVLVASGDSLSSYAGSVIVKPGSTTFASGSALSLSGGTSVEKAGGGADIVTGGELLLMSGNSSANGFAGNVNIVGGSGNSNANAGSVRIFGGTNYFEEGHGGEIEIGSKSAVGTSRDISLMSGESSSSSSSSGNILVSSGAARENSGNLLLSTAKGDQSSLIQLLIYTQVTHSSTLPTSDPFKYQKKFYLFVLLTISYPFGF